MHAANQGYNVVRSGLGMDGLIDFIGYLFRKWYKKVFFIHHSDIQ